MDKRTLIFLLIAVAVGYFFMRPSDEKAIHELLDKIEQTTEVEKTLAPLAALGRLKTLQKLITKDVTIKYHAGDHLKDLKGFENIKNAVMAGIKYISKNNTQRQFTNLQMLGNAAKAKFEVVVEGVANGQDYKELFAFEVKLNKNENWQISHFEITRETP